MTLINNYIFKALDAYPYELEETIEALNYALSYDEKNLMALCLKARIYMDTFYDYEEAKHYFELALEENIKAFHIYPYYIELLFRNEDYKDAEVFLDFALTVKGADKGMLYCKKAILNERKFEYSEALTFLKIAKKYTFEDDELLNIKNVKSRIKNKIKTLEENINDLN